jgi:hypothetical protein
MVMEMSGKLHAAFEGNGESDVNEDVFKNNSV